MFKVIYIVFKTGRKCFRDAGSQWTLFFLSQSNSKLSARMLLVNRYMLCDHCQSSAATDAAEEVINVIFPHGRGFGREHYNKLVGSIPYNVHKYSLAVGINTVPEDSWMRWFREGQTSERLQGGSAFALLDICQDSVRWHTQRMMQTQRDEETTGSCI